MTVEQIVIAAVIVTWIVVLWRVVFPPRSAPAPVPPSPEPPPAPVASVERQTAAPRSAVPMVTLRLMCGDVRDEHARVQIPVATRKPVFVHGGNAYEAVQFNRAQNEYLYRWVRHA